MVTKITQRRFGLFGRTRFPTVLSGAGSYALTGNSASTTAARVVPAAAGVFVETGQAALVEYGRIFHVSAGAFAETGQPAGVYHGFAILAAAGSFSETGQSAGVTGARSLPAAAGSFSLTGIASTSAHGYTVLAAAGSFSLQSPSTTGVLYARKFAVAAGSFVETGSSVGFLYGHAISASAGSFTLAGIAPSLLYWHTLLAAPGVFVEAGSNSQRGQVIGAVAGSFAVTGIAASLLHGHTITAIAGSFVENGTPIEMPVTRSIDAQPGSFVIDGIDTVGSRALVTVSGTFAVTGKPAGMTVARKLSAAAGSFTLTGKPATLSFPLSLNIASGTFSVTGAAAGLHRGYVIKAAAGAFVVSGAAAAINKGRPFPCSPGSFTLTGKAASLNYGHVIKAAAATYIVTPLTTNLMRHFIWNVPTIHYTVTGIPTKRMQLTRVILASAGSFVVTPAAERFIYTRIMHVVAGGYVVNGRVATLSRGKVLHAAGGTFIVSGKTSTQTTDRVILAAAIQYVVTGRAVGSTATRKIAATHVTYVVNGQAVALRPGRSFPASPGSYVVTGKPATLRAAKVLNASAGSFVLNGTTIGLQAGHVIKAVSGAFAVTGKPTAELHSYVILAAPGVFNVYPNPAAGPVYATHIFPGDATFADDGPGAATFIDVDTDGETGDFVEDGPADASVNPSQVADFQGPPPTLLFAGSFAITGHPAGMNAARVLHASPGSVSMSGATIPLEWSLHRTIDSSSGSIGLTGNSATMRLARVLKAAAGSIALTGKPASITPPTGFYDDSSLAPAGYASVCAMPSLPYFNVKLYGAIGNGLVDDTVAIRNAIAAAVTAGGGIVYFPAGNYAVQMQAGDSGTYGNGTLFPVIFVITNSNITFLGAGPPGTSTISGYMPGLLSPATHWTNTGDGYSKISRFGMFRIDSSAAASPISGVQFRSLRLEGNAGYTGDNTVGGNTSTGDGWDLSHKAIAMDGSKAIDNVLIFNCDVSNWRGEELYAGGTNTNHLYILNGHEWGTNADAISASANTFIINNRMGGSAAGDDVYNGIENFNFGAGQQSTVIGCTIQCGSSTVHGNGIALLSNPGNSATIHNNSFINCQSGIEFSEVGSNITVSGNAFTNNVNAMITSILGLYPANPYTGFSNFLIDNNTFTNITGTGVLVQHYDPGSSFPSLVVSGNTISGSGALIGGAFNGAASGWVGFTCSSNTIGSGAKDTGDWQGNVATWTNTTRLSGSIAGTKIDEFGGGLTTTVQPHSDLTFLNSNPHAPSTQLVAIDPADLPNYETGFQTVFSPAANNWALKADSAWNTFGADIIPVVPGGITIRKNSGGKFDHV